VSARGRFAAGVVGWLTLFAIGWTGLLIPSLVRSIEATFGQTDAGVGGLFLASNVAYAAGSFVGGGLTERLGRRPVLGGIVLVHGLGIAGLGLAPDWGLFVLAAMTAGFGAGSLDGGANGLVLDVYREGRGRAMNLLHLSFSVGALIAPVLVGTLVAGGVPWQSVAVTAGMLVALLAIPYALVPMPSGRRGAAIDAADASASPAPASTGDGAPRHRLLAGPLLLLGVAIAIYVAGEVGISNWLVRFLEPAPLTTATLALSLYWAGLAVGRLISSAIADRFDHLRFTIAATLLMAAFPAVAILAPSLPLSIAAFAVAGIASGPVFPMIVAVGGERYPDRSAAVGGSLTGLAIIGAMIYPPAMGLLSVTVGLTVAMLGNVVLAIACAVALVAFGRATRRAGSAS
jgi:fucose permease